MILDTITRLVKQYGIPSTSTDIEKIMREEYGTPAESLPGNEANRDFQFATSDYNSLSNSYRAMRRRLRMSEAVIHHAIRNSAPYAMSCSRLTPPHGRYSSSLQRCMDYISSGWLPRNHKLSIPIVVDENSRFDFSGDLPGNEDHYRIQATCRLTETVYPIRLSGDFSPGMAYGFTVNSSCMTDEEIQSEGWIPVKLSGYTIGARMSEQDDPLQRNFILTITSGSIAGAGLLIGLVMKEMGWIESVSRTEDMTSDQAEIYHTLQSCMNISNSNESRLNEVNRSLDRIRTLISSHQDHLFEQNRALSDTLNEKSILESGSLDRVIEMIDLDLRLVTSIQSMRPVMKAERFTRESNEFLEVTTHPFGMNVYDDFVVRIPSIKFSINMTNNTYHEGIRVFGVEDHSARRFLHPHLSEPSCTSGESSACWGNAGRMLLPEAWGRRDWISLVRALTSWVTQYNSDDPMYYILESDSNILQASSTGWHTTTDGHLVNQEVTA